MKKLLIVTLMMFLMTGCAQNSNPYANFTYDELKEKAAKTPASNFKTDVSVIYNIFPISFSDSNGDGFGDLQGIIDKVDYLNDLGVDAIWLNPITKSNTYHKYDVIDYYTVDEQFGTAEDLDKLIKVLHDNDIKLIMDIVFNHTANDHEWFQKALKNEGDYRNYYRFTDNFDDYISRGGWHEVGDGSYYYGSFGEEMPDVNVNHPKVIEEFQKVLKYYMDKGVDGFRFDAAKHVVDREEVKLGQKVLEDALDFWYQIKLYAKAQNPDVFLVAEVWEDEAGVEPFALAFDSCFDFVYAGELNKVVSMTMQTNLVKNHNRYISAMINKTPNFINTPFLTNHDQNRIADSLAGDMAKLKIAATLLFTSEGIPLVYYGEELGMLGHKPDEQIREPMPFGDKYQTTWEDVILNQQTPTVINQRANNQSLYNFYKRLIAFRKKHPSFKDQTPRQIQLHDNSLLGFENSECVVVINLSPKDKQLNINLSNIIFSEGGVDEQGNVLSGYAIVILKK